MKTDKVISKYLAHYAEVISPWLEGFPCEHAFDRCVVIPAFDENPTFIDHFQQQAPENTLIILVLNCAENCSPSQYQSTLDAKRHLLNFNCHSSSLPHHPQDQISQHLPTESGQQVIWQSPLGSALQLLQIRSSPTERSKSWLIWDICSWENSSLKAGTNVSGPQNNSTSLPGFVHGVGYARKLGMDSALWLFNRHHIVDPFFLSTDADATLPTSYFKHPALLAEHPNTAGYIFPFQHQESTQQYATKEAALLYEITLRYYVLGLRWAQSPWAFHSVGSTLAIHAFHYAACRGFPKKEAGEDFYLLNKVSKTGKILSLKNPSIGLSDRASHRVPFGTGPAVNRIEMLTSIENDFYLYHPECFHWLRQWLATIPQLYTHSLTTALANNSTEPEAVYEILQQLNIHKVITHSRKQSKSLEEFCRHMLTWFDAFKTLKFIHGLRNKYLKSLSTAQWIQQLSENQIPFIPAQPMQDKQMDFSSRILELSHYIATLEQDTLPFISNIDQRS